MTTPAACGNCEGIDPATCLVCRGATPAQPDPAAEMRAAATRLRVPLALPFELAVADWLDDAADGDEHGEHNPYALAVARALLGGAS